jgi:MFS family permease
MTDRQQSSAAPTSADTDGPRPGSLLVVFLTVFIDLLGFGIVLPLLPIYAREFTTDSTGWTIALLMSSYSIMQFLVAPLWGRLSDRIGRRPVLMVGLLGSVLFYSLFALASIYHSLTLLFLSRIGAGIAGATISTAHAYIADTTTLEKRNQGMALIGAAFGLGFTFGPLLGLAAMWGGRAEPGPAPGYLAAGLSAVALLMAVFMLPESLTTRSAHARRSWFDLGALRSALSIPSIGLLLLTSFLCVVAFGNFESTLSLLLKDERQGFDLTYQQLFGVFAYIGLVLALVQGGVVRQLAKRFDEGALGTAGTLIMIAGLGILAAAQWSESIAVLLFALAVCVAGFAFITPSLNSMISRRTDPAAQGGVMGITQSTSSLARIVGPLIGIPLFHVHVLMPMWVGMTLLLAGLLCVILAARGGKDFAGE